MDSFAGRIAQWLTLHTLGRKPGAQEFNREIAAIVIREWPGFLNGSVATITQEQVTEFARRVTDYCPSRWNAIVSALRFVTPAASQLKRRRLRCKEPPMLSDQQLAQLLAALDSRPQSHAGLVVRLLVYTGMRIGEARKLQWSNVDDQGLHLPGSITKNGRPRSIPFIAAARATLDKLKAVSADTVLPQAECKRSLQQACKVAGLPRLSHHDFRHLFATRCIQSGVDIPTVARWLGHTDGGALLLRTYSHTIDEHSRQMAQKVTI